MPVKKSTAKKPVARKAPARAKTAPPAKKTTARKPAAPVETPKTTKRGPGRPRKVVEAPLPIVPAQEYIRYSEADHNRKIQGITYKELADMLGVGVGSERFLVAVELLKGGLDRQAVSQRISDMLPTTTRNGTKKSISNTVSVTLAKLVEQGFTVQGSWKIVKPAGR